MWNFKNLISKGVEKSKHISPLVFAIYTLLFTIFILGPLALGIKEMFITQIGADAPQFIWQANNLLEVIREKDTILESSFFGVSVPYAYTPLSIVQAGSYLSIKLVTNSPYIAFNLTIGIAMFVNFAVMHFVLKKFKFHTHIALLFASIFAFSPALLYHAFYHISLFIAFQLPLFIYFLFKLKTNPTTKNFLLVGLLYALNFYIHEYYVLLLTIFGLTFVVFYWRELLPIKNIKKIILTALVVLVTLIPFAKFYLDKNDFDKTNDIRTVRELNDAHYYSANPFSFVMPPTESHVYSKFTKVLYDHVVPSEQLQYFGFITVLLLIIALVLMTQGKFTLATRNKIYFLAIAIFSAVLSFGPYIVVNNQSWILPVQFAFKLGLEPFDSFRAYGRFGIGTVVVAMFFGPYMYTLLAKKYKFLKNPWLLAVLILVSIIEIYPLNFIPRHKMEVPYTALEKIKMDSDPNFYTASIPLQVAGGLFNSNAMFYQTIHGRAIVNGYSSFTNPQWRTKMENSITRCFNVDIYQAPGCETVTAEQLKAEGIKYLIFEKYTKDEIPPNVKMEDYKKLEAIIFSRFEGVIVEKIYSSDRVIVGRVY